MHTNAQVNFGDARFLSLGLANDGVFATDRYYTNGISIAYHAPKLIDLFHKDQASQQSIELNQKIFTPSKYDQAFIDFDRPFVSSLSIKYQSNILSKNRQLRINHGIEVGIQGKGSGGQAVQNFIHSLLPASEEIEDWQYQLGTDIILNYQFQAEKGIINQEQLMISAIARLMIGSPQLSAELGAQLRVGKLFDRFKYEDYADADWSLFFYTKPLASFTASNTLLQGGLLTYNDPYTLGSIKNLYYSVQTGFYFTKGRWALDYSFTYESRLANDLMPHRWSSLDIIYLLN